MTRREFITLYVCWRRRPWRWPIYRALKRWGVNVGRGKWAPNAELMAKIRGE